MIYILGIPGLIPFYLSVYKIDLVFLKFDKDMFEIYSGLILTFLGAVYWGISLSNKNKFSLPYSIAPCLYVYFLMSADLDFDTNVLFLLGGYLAVLLIDFFFYYKEKLIKTDYFILRVILTAGVIPAHMMYLI